MTKRNPLSFNLFEHPAVSRVSGYVLMFNGEMAGNVITAFPTDGAGICKMQLHIFTGPLSITDTVMRGQAGGYGYDKESAAFADALYRANIDTDGKDLSGRGMSSVWKWVESKGYKVYQAI